MKKKGNKQHNNINNSYNKNFLQTNIIRTNHISLFITFENRVSMEEPDKTNENISNTNNSHQPTRESINKLKHTHTEEKE